MREAYAIYQHYLMALCLGLPLAALAAYGLARLARAARSAGLRRALLAALFAAPAIYLGATKAGRVTVDDAYIEDAGSYLTNDIAHIAIAKKTALLPDDTEILVYAREVASTNAADWARLSPYLAFSGHPYDYALPNATNYNVMVAADYTPPPTVHTNGVWVCYAGELWSSADATAYGFPASKIRTILDPPTAKDYIQDGLIAMWDGIENVGYGQHDSTATVWKDLIGSDDATIVDGAPWSWTEDSFASNNATTYKVVARTSGTTIPVTVQVCYNEWRRTVAYPLIVNLYGSRGIATGNFVWIENNQPAFAGIGTGFHTVTADWTTPQVTDGDTVLSRISSRDIWGTPSVSLQIGYLNNASWPLWGEIHSIRFYDRVLTADEIAHNYEIDRKRFNLP